jgi:hypothetical protein
MRKFPDLLVFLGRLLLEISQRLNGRSDFPAGSGIQEIAWMHALTNE